MHPEHATFMHTKEHMFNPATWKRGEKRVRRRSQTETRLPAPLHQSENLQGGPLQRHSTRNAFWEKYLSKEQSARGA